MITTVTLNVAVDKAYVVEDVKKGEVMRVKSCSNTAGGKGLNVARVIKLCGEQVTATGFAGGHSGSYVEELLDGQQIHNNFVHIDGQTRCCINILASDGTSTEFLEPGSPVSEKEIQEFLCKFQGAAKESDVVTISGSAPMGVPGDFYGKLVDVVKMNGKKVILDTSGDMLKEGLKACPTMIKPNSEELEALLGITIHSREEIIKAAQNIQASGVEMVVISLGGDGAILVTEDAVYHGKPPGIVPVNTVGCGDSMVAAFAVALARNYEAEEALQYAVAVSTANALTMSTGSFVVKDMKEILKQVVVSVIS